MIEVERKVKHLRAGEVVKETHEFEYAAVRSGPLRPARTGAATNLSPRQANAKVLDKLLRRHWTIENRNHYVRDNHWNEDRQTWRSGSSAFVMFVLVSIAMNLLRAASPRWTEEASMPRRSMAADYTVTATPEAVLSKPP